MSVFGNMHLFFYLEISCNVDLARKEEEEEEEQQQELLFIFFESGSSMHLKEVNVS